MATYIVTFSGSIEVENASSKESAITYVKTFNLASDELEFEAEEVEDEEE